MSNAEAVEPEPEPEPENQSIPTQLLMPRTLDYAKRYFHNAQSIGEPGQPNMVEAERLQSQHAIMAQTAALVAIAESLEQINTASRITARNMRNISAYFKTLAAEITKIRYMAKR
jgi:hypothetical protein